MPVLGFIHDVEQYTLSAQAEKVVGSANPNLSQKFAYDAEKRAWSFNKAGKAVQAASIAQQQGTDAEGVSEALGQLRKQVGGGGEKDDSLYSVDLPLDASSGITFYDNQAGQSFTMTPDFEMQEGKLWDGRIIYPFGNGGQIVYTAKTNGIKEDIVLNHFIGEKLEYSYDLKLPKTLEARLQQDGSVGIYSADISLFGNVTYGSDEDRVKVQNARETAPKNHLLFAIPAPDIKDQHGKGAETRFYLNDNRLRIIADGLEELTYPLSLDPSVVVTSSSDFLTGNNEDNIEYGTANQIERTEPTGGRAGDWSQTYALPGSNYTHAMVAYNGYMYSLGGRNSSANNYNTVYYSVIAVDGTLGAWNATTSFTTGRYYLGAAAYNGYLYVYGGFNNSIGALDSLEYAKINSDGTVGSWMTSANTMSLGVCRAGYAVYNGYLYAAGGNNTTTSNCGNSSTPTATVQFAALKANGDTAAWQTTTSFTNIRMDPGVFAYNGYLYVTRGTLEGSTVYADIQYAPINATGGIDSGAWVTNSVADNYPQTDYRFGYTSYNGYLYTAGGVNSTAGSTYALVTASGAVDKPRTMSNIAYEVWGPALVAYKGYLYISGGTDGAPRDTVQYASINPQGHNQDYTTETDTGTSTTSPVNINLGRAGGAAIAYKGCMYLVGGYSGSGGGYSTTVYYSSISSANTLGTWTAVAPTRYMNYGTSNFGFAFYNGRIYLIGGSDGVSLDTIQYTTLNNSGCGMSTWTTNATNYPAAVAGHPAVAYNGYIYQLGDTDTDNDKIYSAPINSDGSVGSWTLLNGAGQTIPIQRVYEAAVVYGKYLYVIGGQRAGAVEDRVHYTELTSGGGITTWSSASTLNTARQRHKAVAYNGYLYVAGGDDNNATVLDSVEYAKINSDGTLGSWTVGQSMTNAQAMHAIAVSEDKVFLINGRTGFDSTTQNRKVYSFRLNNGGSGAIGAWSTSTGLSSIYTNGFSGGNIFAARGYLFTVGGYNPTDGYLDDVYSAPINADGSLGTWTARSSLNTARNNFGIGVSGNRVYVYTGETTGGTRLNTYEYATINSDGSLSAWTSPATMNLSSGSVPKRGNAGSAAYNNYLYIVGGRDGATYYDTTYYAPINTDGTVGTWAASTSFSGSRMVVGTTAYNGYIYLSGGRDSAGNYYRDVQYAPLNSNGSIGSWNYAADLLTDRGYHKMEAVNGSLYVLTGTNTVGNQLNTEYAPINANGTLGTWRTNREMFTNPRSDSGVAIYGGRLYLAGGLDSVPTYFNDVQYAPLKITPRISHYSKLVELGGALDFDSVYFNGTLSGQSSLQYKTAGSDGVLSAAAGASQGSGSEPPLACAAGTVNYVWITLILDDSETATVGGGSVQSEVTDVTVYYTSPTVPPPNKRLFGGKWFYNETQQPLDTCKLSQ